MYRKIINERSKQQSMIKIRQAIDKDDINMAGKWNDKYGKFIRDKVGPPSTAWFDPSLLRPVPHSE